MCEGELKKRIREASDWVEPSYRKAINSIINEVKKEFPTYEWAKKEYLRRVNQKEVLSGLDEAGVQRILADERGEWFKKWFKPEIPDDCVGGRTQNEY